MGNQKRSSGIGDFSHTPMGDIIKNTFPKILGKVGALTP